MVGGRKTTSISWSGQCTEPKPIDKHSGVSIEASWADAKSKKRMKDNLPEDLLVCTIRPQILFFVSKKITDQPKKNVLSWGGIVRSQKKTSRAISFHFNSFKEPWQITFYMYNTVAEKAGYFLWRQFFSSNSRRQSRLTIQRCRM